MKSESKINNLKREGIELYYKILKFMYMKDPIFDEPKGTHGTDRLNFHRWFVGGDASYESLIVKANNKENTILLDIHCGYTCCSFRKGPWVDEFYKMFDEIEAEYLKKEEVESKQLANKYQTAFEEINY